MELRHLRYFTAVAEEAHITRAAERLGIQQPPLSQQIRALEDELGVALFKRGPRGVSLTAAGEVFLRETRAVLAGAARAAQKAQLAAEGREGEIAIGLTTSATLHPLVPAIVGAFGRQYPEVALEVHEGNAADLTEALARGTLQACFLRAVVDRPPGIVFLELLEEEVLLALPEGHRLLAGPAAQRGRETPVRLSDLAEERFILVRRHAAPGLYANLIDACRRAGFEPRVVAEVGRMLTNINLVAAGVGISIVPASMRGIRVGGIHYRRLAARPRLTAPLTLAYRADDERPTLANLLEAARRLSGESGRRRR
jgi:DNA-binding transcriptional LysR family regulator